MTNLISMTSYILGAMQTWMPVSSPEDVARYTKYAHDMAVVALDENEAPLFRNDEDRRLTALTLASTARFEGAYMKNVDEGHCLPHQCDHGTAYSLWQIHPEGGLKLTSDGLWTWSRDPDRITGKTLIQNRQTAVRVALHMIRGSLKSKGNMCTYTGEPCVYHRHPGADQRVGFAKEYAKAHPMTYIEDLRECATP